MSEFKGFSPPDQNWFRVPTEWINISAKMSLSERAVVMYVLRHTWGYGEYDKSKLITQDEFEHGRKRKDGSRIDSGTGLSNASIWKGIKSAVENGYLVVETDTTDMGRIKKRYSIRIYESTTKKTNDGTKKVSRRRLENKNRTEKYTLVKQPKERNPRTGGRKPPSRFSAGFHIDDWDRNFASHLRAILVEHNSDLVSSSNRKKGVRLETLAKNSARLRSERDVPKKRIKEVVKWLSEHYTDKYTPQMYKADDFFAKWSKLETAMSRSSNGNGSVFQKYLEKVENDG